MALVIRNEIKDGNWDYYVVECERLARRQICYRGK